MCASSTPTVETLHRISRRLPYGHPIKCDIYCRSHQLTVRTTKCKEKPSQHITPKPDLKTGTRCPIRSNDEWPKAKHQHGKTPVEAPDHDAIQNPDPTRLQVTWIGHATVLVQYGGLNILTDPVFADRASPFKRVGPKRYSQPGLTIDQLPKLDLVLLSHNHYDHFDLDSLAKLGNTPRYVLPLKNGILLEKAGVTSDRYDEMDWDDQLSHSGVTVIHVPSNHWSSRTTKDRKEMLWGGYILEFADGYRFYFVGDTGWNEALFTELGAQYGGIDFGLIPIGAYDPRDFMRNGVGHSLGHVCLNRRTG